MEVLGPLCVLFVVLLIIMVVGHGLWLLCASVLRFLQGDEIVAARDERSIRQRTCIGCETQFAGDATTCPRCGLNRNSVEARKLRDLTIMARQLVRWQRDTTLPSETIEHVRGVLEEQHAGIVDALGSEVSRKPLPLPRMTETHEEQPSVVPVELPAPPEVPVSLRLQQLLAQRSEADLTSTDRLHVVMWYKEISDEELSAWPFFVQKKLARILDEAGLLTAALRTYERCLKQYPDHLEFVNLALEAAGVAVEMRPEQAREILRTIEERTLTHAQQQDLTNLRWASGEEVEEPAREHVVEEVKPQPAAADFAAVVETATKEEAKPQAAVAVETPAEPEPPEKEPPSRWTNLLAGFMEERNILWGELVGGLLIVGGSIALVVSLWNTLQQNPYFPFGIFATITAALFGAGLYTWSHWKLHATSRGLLVIASLLVPLTYLVLPSTLIVSGVSVASPVNDAWELVVAAAVLLLFGFCLQRATGVLAPVAQWWLPAAVVAGALNQLVTAHLETKHIPVFGWLLVLGIVPVIGQIACTGWVRAKVRRRADFGEAESAMLFATAGISTFAAVVALGFLIVRWSSVQLALQHGTPMFTLVWLALKHLAPLFTLVAIPLFMSGLLVHRRLAFRPKLAALRATGTGVGLTGVAVMFFALAVAWPQPEMVILVCAINFAILAYVAFRYVLPMLHGPALFCLAVGWLTLFHIGKQFSLVQGQLLLEQFLSTSASVQLTVLAVVLGLVAEVLWRLRFEAAARWYTGGMAVVAVCGLALATRHGLWLPDGAVTVYAVAGLGFLVGNLRWRRTWLSYLAMACVAGSVGWGMYLWLPERVSWWSPILAGTMLLMGIMGTVFLQPRFQTHDGYRGLDQLFGTPMLHCAEAGAVFVLLMVAWSRRPGSWLLESYFHVGQWLPEHVLAGTLLMVLYFLLMAKQRRWLPGTMAGLVTIGSVIAATESISVFFASDAVEGWIGFLMALTGCVMASITVYVSHLASTSAKRKLSAKRKPPTTFTFRASTSAPWYTLLPTAWREVTITAAALALWVGLSSPSFPSASVHTFTLLSTATITFLLALQYRQPVATWIGATLLLAGVGHGLTWAWPLPMEYNVLQALLLHATALIAVAIVLQRGTATTQTVFARPLLWSGLLSTFLVLPVLFVLRRLELDFTTEAMRSLAGFTAWLSLLWLIVSVHRRWLPLFAGFQLAAMLTVIYGISAWVVTQSWSRGSPALYWQPITLQAYGIGLTLLAGAFVVARLALQHTGVGRVLLRPNWPGIDRWLPAVLLGTQLVLVEWAIVRDVLSEIMLPTLGWNPSWWPVYYADAYGPLAWWWFAILALVVVTSLWQPSPPARQITAMLGLATLALTLSVLIAGLFAASNSAASALRWAGAGLYLLCSIPVWSRDTLTTWTPWVRMPTLSVTWLSRAVRAVLFVGLACPVLLITVVMAILLLRGDTIPGPAHPMFATMDTQVFFFVPLALIGVALVGHAVREQSPGYAFGAGVLLTAVATGGYALGLVLAKLTFGYAETVTLLHIATICTAAWGMAWLVSRRWLHAWREDGHAPLARPLMLVQVAAPVLLNVIVLVPAVLMLTTPTRWRPLSVSEPWYPAVTKWTRTAGMWPGWAALLLTVSAVWLQQRREISPRWLGSSCLALIVLAVCTLADWFPGQGYRCLVAGLSVFTMGWASVPALSRATGQPRYYPFFHAAPVWVYIGALLLVPLSLQGIFVHHDVVWCAPWLALAGLAVLAVGFQRREEYSILLGTALTAVGQCVLVWHYHVSLPLDEWWVHLFQVVGLTILVVALGWLRLAGEDLKRARQLDSLLPLQIAAGVLCALVPLIGWVSMLVLVPDSPPAFASQMTNVAGWTVPLITVLVLAWFVGLRQPARLVHVTGAGVLMAAGQIAAGMHVWDDGNWLCYHVVAVVVTLGGGLFSSVGFLPYVKQSPRFIITRSRAWLEGFALLLMALAFRGATLDPALPWLSALWLASATGLIVVLLIGTRRATYLHILGLLLSLQGLVFFLAWGQRQADQFIGMMVLSAAVAASVLYVLEEWHKRQPLETKQEQRLPSDEFAPHTWLALTILCGLSLLLLLAGKVETGSATRQHVLGILVTTVLPVGLVTLFFVTILSDMGKTIATSSRLQTSFAAPVCVLALCLLGGLVVFGLGSDLGRGELSFASPLFWAAWIAVTVACVVRVYVPEATTNFSAAPLYWAALLATGLALHQSELQPARLLWAATSALAGFLLLAAGMGWTVSRWQRRLTMPTQSWFLPVQACLAIPVVLLSFWVCTQFAEAADRLLGPFSMALLVGGSIFMTSTPSLVDDSPQRPRIYDTLHYVTFLLGGAAVLTFAWSWTEPGRIYLSLLRHILLLGTLGFLTVFYGVVLNRWLPAGSTWRHHGQNLARFLWLIGMVSVLTVLTHELSVLHPALSPVAALDLWAIIFVGVVLVAFIVSSIWFAVHPQHDPFALSDNWRTKYVYAAEVLVVLLLLHLRLTYPELFQGPLKRYAPFIIMGIAFLGVGLSEWFARLNLRVLSVPIQRTGLFLPLLPLLTFWLQSSGDIWQLILGKQGISLEDLRWADLDFGKYSLYWFLASAVYLLMAYIRRSSWFALLAALVINFGFWSLLFQYRGLGLGFFRHPQLWLIPLALILLATEHINRDRLKPATGVAVRYFALIVLYVSSTADLFIAGLGDIGMSLALVALAVIGILAGIFLRVRAFLFAGVSFLLLVIGVRIWHAAVDQAQVWVWWVAVICLGITILTMFALFEKRRIDMLKMLEELKRWQ